MKISMIISASAAVGLILTAGVALAQGMNDQPSSPGGDMKMQQGGGMSGMNMGGAKQGGMGMGMGGMGMGGTGQSQGSAGMGSGKQAGGCGMMGMMGMGQQGGMGQQQSGDVAALQERVNQLEQRLNAGQGSAKP